MRGRIRVNPFTGCWEWQHARQKPETPGWNRYAGTMWDGRAESVHRIVYRLLAGPLDPDLELDHVYARGCRSKACCWPAHLEQVTEKENHARANRANLSRGVARTVLKRIASGSATSDDLALVDAAFMLPSPEIAEAIDDAAAKRRAHLAQVRARLGLL